ncbi:uncharacterized protein LOC121875363 isoform X1 [Homarus americanus]|uniref:uncharacterized protein LOC121875363 isoform X1 n=1 Tax=Homarus americanus TaxID=6706 RepID=UPI001C48BE58|nr:uncharacterized protein LOC121875363 isoform X1 [Homarus americanus]
MEGEDVFVPPDDAGPGGPVDRVEEPAVAVSETAQAEGQAQESQSPWPHLDDYFVLKSRDKRNANILYFQCVICQPKETTIKGQATSLYNLKSHVKRKHPAHAIQFEERIKAGSSRGKHRQSSGSGASSRSSSQSLQPPAKKPRQPTIDEAFGQSAAGTGVRQSVVDKRIVDLFVCNMLPLHVVESPTFVSLIKTLNPSKTSMSRRTLGRRILASHKQLEEYLRSPRRAGATGH